ncbi:MAG: hypothetical protein HQ561_07975, partial [Desulfobacteraceae bacterium]|nr:hypothetical protein [Desulfobacteraceae bacterium]
MKNRKTIKKQWYSTLLKASDEMEPVDSLSSAGGELSVEEAYGCKSGVLEYWNIGVLGPKTEKDLILV